MSGPYYVVRRVDMVSKSTTQTSWTLNRTGDGTLAEVFDATLAYKIAELLNHEQKRGSDGGSGA